MFTYEDLEEYILEQTEPGQEAERYETDFRHRSGENEGRRSEENTGSGKKTIRKDAQRCVKKDVRDTGRRRRPNNRSTICDWTEIMEQSKQKERRTKRQCLILGAAALILLGAVGFSEYQENQVEYVNLEDGRQIMTWKDDVTEYEDKAAETYGEKDTGVYADKNADRDVDEGMGRKTGFFSWIRGGEKKLVGTDIDLMILVNKENPIPNDYEVELHWLKNGMCAVAEEMYGPLSEMLTAGADEGLSFVVASGYRDSDRQQELLEEDIQATMIREGMSWQEAYDYETRETMPPGYSEHETGLAVDIVSLHYQMLDERQEMTEESRWLREHCDEFGFILRYPKGKEDITGIDYESWHFRYVGKDAAKEIMKRGITLEEYLKE